MRHFFGLFRGNAAEIVQDGDVFLWKSVWPAQGAHGDVVRGPWADAGEFRQALNRSVRIMMRTAVER